MNTAAKNILADYLTTQDPGYALLITAPWGAGKTHFVEAETKFTDDENICYLSLFGIASPEQFNQKLVRAVLGKFGGVAEAAQKLFKGGRVWGVSINLGELPLIDYAMKKLPQTLIFDDLERCAMPPQQISGLLNEFIEHRKCRVILVANVDKVADDPTLSEEDANPNKQAFDAQKEKLIGPVVELQANPERALKGFFAKINAGPGKDYLQANQELVLQVFEEAGHQNLRLLRQALRALAGVIDKMEDDLRENSAAMRTFAHTFLALHMAYHGGRITKEDVAARGGISLVISTQGPTDQQKRMQALDNAHPRAQIMADHGDVLPGLLGVDLVVKGWVPEATLNAALRKTRQFKPPVEWPDWMRLWHFEDESFDELKGILNRIDHHMLSMKLEVPGEMVQVYGALQHLSHFWPEIDSAKIACLFSAYIEELHRNKKLKPRIATGKGDRSGYGFDFQPGARITCRGYSFELETERDRYFINHLCRRMDEEYEVQLIEQANRLKTSLRVNPSDFVAAFEHTSTGWNFSETAIVHLMDCEKTADTLMSYFDGDKDTCKELFTCLGKRLRGDAALALEAEWIDGLKETLIRKADETSPLKAAQMRKFIAYHMKSR